MVGDQNTKKSISKEILGVASIQLKVWVYFSISGEAVPCQRAAGSGENWGGGAGSW